MTNSPDQALKERLADILGLETDPDGNPYYLLTRDEDGTILEGVDYSDEVEELAQLIHAREARLQEKVLATIGPVPEDLDKYNGEIYGMYSERGSIRQAVKGIFKETTK